MLIGCIRFLSRYEEAVFGFVLFQLFMCVYTLILLRGGLMKETDESEVPQRGNRNDQLLFLETEKHARKLFAEISQKGYDTPNCTRLKSPGGVCHVLQVSFSRAAVGTATAGIPADVFGSCLGMVDRLIQGQSRNKNPQSVGDLRKYLPTDLQQSSFVNLGEYIFSEERQWIPTTCVNASKVAVIINGGRMMGSPFNETLLRVLIYQLQRRVAHFGIFVIDYDGHFRHDLDDYKLYLPEWDYYLYLGMNSRRREMTCSSSFKQFKTKNKISIKHILGNAVVPKEVRSLQSHLLYTELKLGSYSATSRAKKRKFRPQRKMWRLTNLKQYGDPDDSLLNISLSLPVVDQYDVR